MRVQVPPPALVETTTTITFTSTIFTIQIIDISNQHFVYNLPLMVIVIVRSKCNHHARVVKLVDTHGSGPCGRKSLQVQVLSLAHKLSDQTPLVFS